MAEASRLGSSSPRRPKCGQRRFSASGRALMQRIAIDIWAALACGAAAQRVPTCAILAAGRRARGEYGSRARKSRGTHFFQLLQPLHRASTAGRSIVIITSPGDEALDNQVAASMANACAARAQNAVQTHQLPDNLGLRHDCIDHNQPHQRVAVV